MVRTNPKSVLSLGAFLDLPTLLQPGISADADLRRGPGEEKAKNEMVSGRANRQSIVSVIANSAEHCNSRCLQIGHFSSPLVWTGAWHAMAATPRMGRHFPRPQIMTSSAFENIPKAHIPITSLRRAATDYRYDIGQGQTHLVRMCLLPFEKDQM